MKVNVEHISKQPPTNSITPAPIVTNTSQKPVKNNNTSRPITVQTKPSSTTVTTQINKNKDKAWNTVTKSMKGSWEGPSKTGQTIKTASILQKIHIRTNRLDVTKEEIKTQWLPLWEVSENKSEVIQLTKSEYMNTFCIYFKSCKPNTFKQFIPTYVKWSYYKGQTKPKEYTERAQVKSYFLSQLGSDVTEEILRSRITTAFDNIKQDKIEIHIFENKDRHKQYKNAFLRLTAIDTTSDILQMQDCFCNVDRWKRRFPPRELQNIARPMLASEFSEGNKKTNFKNLINKDTTTWTFSTKTKSNE